MRCGGATCSVWLGLLLIILILDCGPDDGVGVAGNGLLTVISAQSCNGNLVKGELGLGQEILLQIVKYLHDLGAEIVKQVAWGLGGDALQLLFLC